MTTGLIKSIKYKHRLYTKYINKPTEQNKHKYTTYRNKLTTLLKEAKSKYYKDKFDHAKHDVKKTWKIIKLILNNNTGSRKSDTKLNHEGRQVNDPHEVADIFNNYFTNIGPSLNSKIPQTDVSFRDF